MKQTFNTCLPHTARHHIALARCYTTVDGEPGFSSEYLEALKILIKNDSSKRKLCGLSFDEMALRKCVEWDGEQFICFVSIL